MWQSLQSSSPSLDAPRCRSFRPFAFPFLRPSPSSSIPSNIAIPEPLPMDQPQNPTEAHSASPANSPSNPKPHLPQTATPVPPAQPEPTPAAPSSDPPANGTPLPTKRQLLFCGSTKWDVIGRKSVPKAVLQRGGTDAGAEHIAPVRLSFAHLTDVDFHAVHAGPTAAHVILIDAAGAPYGMGRNDTGQLGFADLRARPAAVRLHPPLKKGETILSAACGKAHTLLVSSTGRAFAAGANAHGQLGAGSCASVDGWRVVSIASDVRVLSAAAGVEFSMFACEGGRVFAAGCAEHGQLGNGRTGEHIASRGKVVFDIISTPGAVAFPKDVKIVQVACGANHTLALDDKGKVWSWGWGGYGRLGHKLPKDELVPKSISVFEGDGYKIDFVAAGGSCSFGVQRSRKCVMFWGVTKKSGESYMYPKPLFDLQGWEARSVAGGMTSVVVAAERSTISWGPSPVFGELGYGKGPKSSTSPKKMEALEGLEVKQVAMGVAFTLMIAEYTEEEDSILAALEQLVVEETEKTEVEEGPKNKRKARPAAKASRKRRR